MAIPYRTAIVGSRSASRAGAAAGAHQREQRLSTADKSTIYDWLRGAADGEIARNEIINAFEEAAVQAPSAQEFDELIFQAMIRHTRHRA